MTSKHTKQDSLTSDSGYSSGSSAPDRKREIEDSASDFFFSIFRDELKEFIEINDSDLQAEFVNSFIKRNKTRTENFLFLFDFSLKKFQKTKLADNEGAVLLLFSRSCTSSEAIFSLLKLYSEKNSLSSSEFLLKCEDETESNVLHYLATAIVKKHNRSNSISEKDWAAFKKVSEIAPILRERNDIWNSTPLEKITEEIPLSLELDECYQVSFLG